MRGKRKIRRGRKEKKRRGRRGEINKKRKRFGQSAPNLFLIKMTVIDSPTCGKIMSFYVFLRSLL